MAPADSPALEPRSATGHTTVVKNPVNLAAALDDVRLLRRIARREPEAFSRFYDRYAGVLYATAIRVLNDPQEASDLLQAVFEQIWDDAPAYDPANGKPFNWALTMTRHKAIDRLRALQRRYAFFAEIAGEEGEVQPGQDKASTSDPATLVRNTLAALPYEQRQAIELSFLGGMSAEEMGETLGQPPGTLKARIRRGMFKLRESFRSLL